MSFLRRTRDGDLRSPLSGRVLASDAGLGVVAAFVRDLEAAYPSEPLPLDRETAHKAAMAAAARLVAERGDTSERRRQAQEWLGHGDPAKSMRHRGLRVARAQLIGCSDAPFRRPRALREGTPGSMFMESDSVPATGGPHRMRGTV